MLERSQLARERTARLDIRPDYTFTAQTIRSSQFAVAEASSPFLQPCLEARHSTLLDFLVALETVHEALKLGLLTGDTLSSSELIISRGNNVHSISMTSAKCICTSWSLH